VGLLAKFGANQATKLIRHYTGEVVDPSFVCSCDADISPDWRGVVVLERDNLWLVNRLSARGIQMSRLTRGSVWGQFPPGTRGYPKHGFQFIADTGDRFTIYPITQDDGWKLEMLLERYVKE
jgi:hypothetical protein